MLKTLITALVILGASLTFAQGTIGNAGAGTAYAGVDSFSVTSVGDTIRIPGLTATGEKFTFAEWTPDYDSAIDTVIYSYRTKTDTVFVTRTGVNPGAVYKSAGKYSWIREKK